MRFAFDLAAGAHREAEVARGHDLAVAQRLHAEASPSTRGGQFLGENLPLGAQRDQACEEQEQGGEASHGLNLGISRPFGESGAVRPAFPFDSAPGPPWSRSFAMKPPAQSTTSPRSAVGRIRISAKITILGR